MSPKHLLLTGYRGCGKSVVGQLLSQLLSRTLVDVDIAIESTAGKSIAEIFAESGEVAFRDLESAQIEALGLLPEPAIISLGGGAILRSENRRRIQTLGFTVWLQASPETVAQRIASDVFTRSRRPKLSKLGDMEEIRSILESRLAWYKEVADFAVDTDNLTMQQVADTIVDRFQLIT